MLMHQLNALSEKPILDTPKMQTTSPPTHATVRKPSPIQCGAARHPCLRDSMETAKGGINPLI